MEEMRTAAEGCVEREQKADRAKPEPLVRGGHDQLPDSGRWLFVVDRREWDAGREGGVWMQADADRLQMGLLLPSVIGSRPARADLLVVDQLGIEEMVDEDYFVPDRMP